MPFYYSHSKTAADLALVVFFGSGAFLVGAATEFSERMGTGLRPYEALQLDELPFALLAFSLGLAWFGWRRWRETQDEIARRRAAEEAIEAQRQHLRQLSHRVIDAQERERRELAHELHDELGQTLNAIKLEAVRIRDAIGGDRSTAEVSAKSIIELTDGLYDLVRDMTSRLRPLALEELGLADALEHTLARWRERLPGTRLRFIDGGCPARIGDDSAIALYRVAQEGLTNAIRHASAKDIALELTWRETAGLIFLTLADDGCGFDTLSAPRGLGLLGMRERIEALGGRFSVESRPGHGTRIVACLPIRPTMADSP